MNLPRMLVIDDEREVGTFFKHLFRSQFDMTVVDSGEDAERVITSQFFDLAFVDLKLSDSDGLTLLKRINASIPSCRVIIMTGYSTISSAVQAIQQGAFNYIEKPFEDLNYLRKLAAEALGGETAIDEGKDGFVVGSYYEMRSIVSMAKKVADKKLTVLIEGETGTGKEVLARYIHRNSDRAGQPFLAVNCGAFSETLLESELFGHEKGAFTGAVSSRRGIFEMANKGTLFLDEISEASSASQVKLLRLLENEECYRIGGERPYHCDVRLIAATNARLADAVKQGRFREDLFYRLNVISFHLPPLRERREDIPLIVSQLIRQRFQKSSIVVTEGVMQYLTDYPWPGNIRELINVIAHALAMSNGREIILENLPAKILQRLPERGEGNVRNITQLMNDSIERLIKGGDTAEGVSLPVLLEEIKDIQRDVVRNVISRVLEKNGGNQILTAKSLGITTRQLQYYLHEK